MRVTTALLALGGAVCGQAANSTASAVHDNIPGAVFKATLPEKPFFSEAAILGNVKGSISAMTTADGDAVKLSVSFENLPAEGGPFTQDGNCTSTKDHLDPFGRGVEVPCVSTAPATCQVGDLSGKHGVVDQDPFHADYLDRYVSANSKNVAYFGNLSFVLHYANGTRLTCANFVQKTKPVPPPPTFPSGNCSASACGSVAPSSVLTTLSSATVLPIPTSLPVSGAVLVRSQLDRACGLLVLAVAWVL